MESRKKWVMVALIIIILLAAFLRIKGMTWGLPGEFESGTYNRDESSILVAIGNLNPAELDFNPDFFNYPTLYIYMVAAALKLGSVFGFVDLVPSMEYYVDNPLQGAALFLIGRFITAIMGIATVLLVYLVAAKLYGRRTGIIAALLFSIAHMHVIDSHYMSVDVPVTFFIMLSVFFSVKLLDSKKPLLISSLAGIFAGFAAATKYNGAIALLPFLVAYLYRNKIRSLKDIVSKPLIAFFLFLVVGFLVGCPYSVLDRDNFIEDVSIETNHVSTGHYGWDTNAQG